MNNTENMLSSLSCYMLNNANITNILNNIPTINNKRKRLLIIQILILVEKIFFITQMVPADTLFWMYKIFLQKVWMLCILQTINLQVKKMKNSC